MGITLKKVYKYIFIILFILFGLNENAVSTVENIKLIGKWTSTFYSYDSSINIGHVWYPRRYLLK